MRKPPVLFSLGCLFGVFVTSIMVVLIQTSVEKTALAQSASVEKRGRDQLGAFDVTTVHKFDTVDLKLLQGYHSGAPLRIRVDEIKWIIPHVTVETKKVGTGATAVTTNTYFYHSQLGTTHGTFYIDMTYDALAKKLLTLYWGTGVPAVYTTQPATQATMGSSQSSSATPPSWMTWINDPQAMANLRVQMSDWQWKQYINKNKGEYRHQNRLQLEQQARAGTKTYYGQK